MIKFADITKSYNGKNVVDIENLYLLKNRIYGLIGPNGAGKTTTIRMLIGLLNPSSGEISIQGNIVGKSVETKKIIGYIPDVPNLYEHLTGIEHIIFVASLYGFRKNEILDNILKLADVFELGNKIYEPIDMYSKGTKQKISIMSALIHNPKILILDEPFTGLDPVVIKKFKDYLRKYAKRDNNIVIFSTHDLDVASDICTDIIVMNQGKIRYNGKIDALTESDSLEEAFMCLIERK